VIREVMSSDFVPPERSSQGALDKLLLPISEWFPAGEAEAGSAGSAGLKRASIGNIERVGH
jgi:hypothetical protein